MSHSAHGEERALVGEDIDKGLGVGKQAYHIVVNSNRVGHQLPLPTM